MKRNKIKIQVGYEKLTDKEVQSHKDFKRVYANYHKMTDPMYKRPKFFAGLIVIAAVAMVLLMEPWQGEEEENSSQQQTIPDVNQGKKSNDSLRNKNNIQYTDSVNKTNEHENSEH